MASATPIELYDDLPTEPDEVVARIFDISRHQHDLVRLYHQLRNVAPVHQSQIERLGRPWMITRHADAALVAREKNLIKDERLVDQLGSDPAGPFATTMKRMMNFMAPPRHTRLRQLVNRGFSLRSVERLRPGVRKHVGEILDARISDGRMDLVRDFAHPIPLITICELLGVPVDEAHLMEGWARQIIESVDEAKIVGEEDEANRNEAILGFSGYFQSLIDARRAAPREDLISRLVEVQRDEGDFSDEDIIATCILMFQAGHDTTASLIAKGTLALLRHPEQLTKLRETPDLIENATEELLRYDTSVQLSLNYAVADVPFHGRTIHEGDAVIILRGAANRDPARFDHPDRLDIERADIDHHSFGLGAHFCLGASLARLEIQEAIGGLVRRLPRLHVDPDAVVYRPSLHLHGLDSMPVEW